MVYVCIAMDVGDICLSSYTYLPSYLPTSPISMKPSTALATQIVESEIDRSIDGMKRGEEIFKTL